jgi:glycosyltransferase involved in cell wall biosynthesis
LPGASVIKRRLSWRRGVEGEIDLLGAYRTIGTNDLTREGDFWRASGTDPYLVFRIDGTANRGALIIELDIQVLEGRIYPRVYFQKGEGFSQQASELMRRTGMGHYKLTAYLTEASNMLRLDPAESACAFRIRQFSIRRTTPATFFMRTLRNGANKGEEKPKFGRVMRAIRQALKTGIAFETIEGGKTEKPADSRYLRWINYFDYSEEDRSSVEARIEYLAAKPLISVLMPVYNTPETLLDDAIASVATQIYDNWELCIADDASTAPWVRPTLERWMMRDPRIKVNFRSENGHIAAATNSAFELATGEFVALLDHDDILRPHALAEVAFALDRNPDAEIIYSDEDKIEEDGRRRFDPFFKPDWNPDLFLSQNYLNHLTVHRTANIRATGGWRQDYYGSQDYDLNLRIVRAIDQRRIVHIPKILYHWRLTPQSMAQDEGSKGYAVESAIKALQSYLDGSETRGLVEQIPETNWYRIRYALPEPAPLASLIIPTRNGFAILKSCIDSIVAKTTYPNYEIIIVDNGSDDPETLSYFRDLEARGAARVLPYPHPFNYSAINNFAVAQAKGNVVALVNNDIEVISPDWLTEMVSLALRPGIGCVGAKLYYPNDTIQHAGVIVGLGGVAGHSHKMFERKARGYFGRLKVTQNVSAVTGACLVVKKSIYEEVGGLDEENLKVAFNDVDFCLKVTEAGYFNVWTPFAELYHHESVSRGSEDDPVKRARFKSEVLFMKSKWGSVLSGDPHYSPHLTLKYEDYSINAE